MITKEQALALRYGQELHCTVVQQCKRTVGPRGGVKESIVRVRVSGKCQTWKTRPSEFRVPVKYGLYESSSITEYNAMQFHLPGDCPLAAASDLEQRARALCPLHCSHNP